MTTEEVKSYRNQLALYRWNFLKIVLSRRFFMLRDFPNVMKYQREHLGITMQELSRVTMVSVQSLYKYESGERTPSLMVFLRICGALQINPQCFL